MNLERRFVLSFWSRMTSSLVNTHRRMVPGDLAESGALLNAIAEPGSVWPTGWPPLRLDQGLAVGSRGGHGPIRYAVVAHEPGRSVSFEMLPETGFAGRHRFNLEPCDGGVRWTHILSIDEPTRLVQMMVVPLHDQLLEELLDNAAARLAGLPDPPPRRPLGVRLRRGIIQRLRSAPR